MIEPRRIGRFLATDEFGFIRPDVSAQAVGEAWRPLVDFVRDALMTRACVQAVYLRGSIPRGLAEPGVADADFLYLSEIDGDAADFDLETMAARNFPIASGVHVFRLSRAARDKIRHPQRRPYFHMLLKTQCLFLAGDDFAGDIAPFAVGRELASHIFTLAAEFALLPRWLDEDCKQGVDPAIRRKWFSKRLVRAGFEATLDRTDRFTRDLYLCCEQFGAFYPEWSDQMRQVLNNGLNGRQDPLEYRTLVAFVAREGQD